MIVRAINQQAANAGRSHFAEGDFLLACRRGRFGHGWIKAPCAAIGKLIRGVDSLPTTRRWPC
jgi:hypothetical protein